jgi:hypothetical protein
MPGDSLGSPKSKSEGPATAGTSATKSWLIGGVYNTSAPTLLTGQQVAAQMDVNGRILVSAAISSTGIADKTTYTYGTTTFQPVGGVYQDTLPSLTAGQSGSFRLTAYRAIHVNLRDSSGNEISAQNNQIKTADICDTSTVQATVTVGTSAVVAKVGASNLSNRKIVNVFHNGSGKLYWGGSGVTTASGTQIFKNTSVSIPAGPNNSVYLISDTAGQDIRVVELS